MSEEFIVYDGNTNTGSVDDNEFEVQGDTSSGSSSSPLDLDSETFESSLTELDLDSSDGKFFTQCMLHWMCYHLDYDVQVENLEAGLRDGIVLHKLIIALKCETVLPFEKPCSPVEMVENLYCLISDVLDASGVEMDSDTMRDYATKMFEGELGVILPFIMTIGRIFVIDSVSDPLEGKSGIEYLEHWLQDKVSISENVFCRSTSIANIEQPDNLLKLVRHMKIDVPEDFKSPINQNKQYQLLIQKETGIPCLLNQQINLEEDDIDDNDLGWYLFLRYLYIAEIYDSCLILTNRYKKKKTVQNGSKRPKDVLVNAISTSYERQLYLRDLEDNCHTLHDWIQSKITLFKNEMLSFEDSYDVGTRNIALLTDLYKIMNEEQIQYSKLKAQSYAIHSKIQRAVKNEDLEPIAYHDKYNIYNVEKEWACLREVEVKLEKRMQNFITHAENKKTTYEQWKSEISGLKQWMKRWEMFFLEDDVKLRLNSTALQHRLIAYTKEFVSDQITYNTVKIKELTQKLKDFSLDEDEKLQIETISKEVCAEYDQFIQDSIDIMEMFDEHQEEATSLDVMYNEISDLMNRLDDQMHELHLYYTLRPQLSSVHSCDQLASYIKDTWKILFEIASEIDAVYSLDEDIKKMCEKLDSHPVNCLTSLTPTCIQQRWDALLFEAHNAENYVMQQRNLCLHHYSHVEEFDKKLEIATGVLENKLVELNTALVSDDDEVVQTIKEFLCEQYESKYLDELHDISFSLPDNIPQLGRTFDNILTLRECLQYCQSTIELVLADEEMADHIMHDRELQLDNTMKYICEISTFHDKQLLPTFEQACSFLVSVEDKKRLRDVVKHVDPLFGRVTISSWLDFRRPNKYTTTDVIEKELNKSFMLISENDKYIMEKDIKQYIEPEQRKYLLHHMTEYFGPDYEPVNGEKAYDYRRLACNLVGKHKKLLINPE